MANSTFLLGVGPANIHSQFHLIYHVWWLEVSWSAGLALSAGKDADSITYSGSFSSGGSFSRLP